MSRLLFALELRRQISKIFFYRILRITTDRLIHEPFNHEWPCQNRIRIFGLEIQCTMYQSNNKFSNKNCLCMEGFQTKSNERTYDKWNFKSKISSIFRDDQVTDGWMSHLFGVKLNLSIIICKYVFLSREIIFHLHVFFHVFLCFREIKNRLSQVFLRSSVFSTSIFLPSVIIEVQNGKGVLNRLVLCKVVIL